MHSAWSETGPEAHGESTKLDVHVIASCPSCFPLVNHHFPKSIPQHMNDFSGTLHRKGGHIIKLSGKILQILSLSYRIKMQIHIIKALKSSLVAKTV